MSVNKPASPKGTRDFGPEQSAKRAFIIDTIKRNFKRYGFQQLETPAMENLSTLTGKYGDEGDQLLFKIVNSGDFLSKVPENKRHSSNELLPLISEKGLRYDLTVPFARYVVSHQHEITFPFKRFQIQPVWRADRPQRGRYREFYQCDADIIGTQSIWNEAELTLLIHDVFDELQLTDFSLKVNHRAILNAMANYCGLKGKEIPFCVELDKLDKTSPVQVMEEMKVIGGNAANITKTMAFIQKEQSVEEKLDILQKEYRVGDRSINRYFEMIALFDRYFHIDLDLSLARGLTYYTGMVFEVKPTTVQMGSLCGGGRYDNLTGVFGLPDVSGVGISFGLDRIFDVMEELHLFPSELTQSVEVLIVHFDEACFRAGLSLVNQFRKHGISADIYPESVKIKKQFNYADKVNAKHTLVIGSEELACGKFKLKDMKTSEQTELTAEQIIDKLQTK